MSKYLEIWAVGQGISLTLGRKQKHLLHRGGMDYSPRERKNPAQCWLQIKKRRRQPGEKVRHGGLKKKKKKETEAPQHLR